MDTPPLAGKQHGDLLLCAARDNTAVIVVIGVLPSGMTDRPLHCGLRLSPGDASPAQLYSYNDQGIATAFGMPPALHHSFFAPGLIPEAPPAAPADITRVAGHLKLPSEVVPSDLVGIILPFANVTAVPLGKQLTLVRLDGSVLDYGAVAWSGPPPEGTSYAVASALMTRYKADYSIRQILSGWRTLRAVNDKPAAAYQTCGSDYWYLEVRDGTAPGPGAIFDLYLNSNQVASVGGETQDAFVAADSYVFQHYREA